MPRVPWPFQRDASRQVACLTEGVYRVTPFAGDSTNFLLYAQDTRKGYPMPHVMNKAGDYVIDDYNFMVHVDSLVQAITGNDTGRLSLIRDFFNDSGNYRSSPMDINAADLGKVWYSPYCGKLRITNNVGKEYMFVDWGVMNYVSATVAKKYSWDTALVEKCDSIYFFLVQIQHESLQLGTAELLHVEFPGPLPLLGDSRNAIVIETRVGIELGTNKVESGVTVEPNGEMRVGADAGLTREEPQSLLGVVERECNDGVGVVVSEEP
eukprot:1198739-Rhodomonas_salina.1